MFTISLTLALLMATTPIDGDPGFEPCSANKGPVVGVGILCDRALMALEAREIGVADRLSQTATELAPSHPGAWVVRAKVAQRARRVAEARDHYETAAGLEPDNAGLLIAMGDFEAAEGNVRGAAVLYERAAGLDPMFPGLSERLDALGDDPQANEI
ncbi:MAG: hypothetical protein AAF511_03580 [Pseudomonadota bacterium]